MSGELNKARRAFRALLLTVPDLPAQRAWEDEVFQPAIGTAWVSEEFAQTSRRPIGVGGGAAVTLRHEFRAGIGLRYPREVGATSSLKTAEDVAGAICDTFRPGASLTVDGFSIKVAWSEARAVLRNDSAWFHLPVIVALYGWSVTS